MPAAGAHRKRDHSVRPSRRLTVLAALSTLTVIGVDAVTVAAPWSHAAAAATPTQVLQSVNLDMGANGTLYAVKTDNIGRSSSGFSTTSQSFSPATASKSLPVQVSMSYLHNGQTGTDLSKLAGASGLVEVDVTVANTTVHAQQLHYTVGGAERSAYAL